MAQNYLSNIELYYSDKIDKNTENILIDSDEAKHITKVMRHQVGDKIFVTDGLGAIYETEIADILKRELSVKIIKTIKYQNQFENVTFCFPRLKTADRFEFALEKCVELGITNFIIYQAERSISKGEKLDRWNKIAQSAMKQSLRSFLPNIEFSKKISSIKVFDNRFMLDQNAKQSLADIKTTLNKNESYLLTFGPEGGYSENELEMLKDFDQLKLTENRLRAETAVITAASVICTS